MGLWDTIFKTQTNKNKNPLLEILKKKIKCLKLFSQSGCGQSHWKEATGLVNCAWFFPDLGISICVNDTWKDRHTMTFGQTPLSTNGKELASVNRESFVGAKK